MDGRHAAGRAGHNPYADVQVELTAMIFDRLMPTVVLGGVSIVGATAVLAAHYNDVWLWKLTAVMAVLWIWRMAIVSRLHSDTLRAMTATAAARLELRYGLLSALYFCTMAASILHSGTASDSVGLGFCTLGTFVFCNAISARLGMKPWLTMLPGVVMIAALAVAVLHSKYALTRYSVVFLVNYGLSLWESNKVKFDITVEQLRGRHKQRHLAEHDALTGLANRRHFEARLEALCKENEAFAVFFLDLDGFKTINDAHGHAIGDALLEHVAQRLQGAVRHSDLAARLGGDEFAILHTPKASHETATALAVRLIERISTPYEMDGLELRIGTSIGIQLSQSRREEPDAILRQADDALYAVKHSGKGRFLFAEDKRQPLADLPGGDLKLLTV